LIRPPFLYIIVPVFIFIVTCYILSHYYVIQISGSLPRGIYKKVPIFGKISRGQLVLVTIPVEARQLMINRGWIPGHLTYHLIKPVEAIPGDHVKVDHTGVYINNRYKGALRQKDQQGLMLPQFRFNGVLHPNTYFLLGQGANSFDSRYIGPVHKQLILCFVE